MYLILNLGIALHYGAEPRFGKTAYPTAIGGTNRAGGDTIFSCNLCGLITVSKGGIYFASARWNSAG